MIIEQCSSNIYWLLSWYHIHSCNKIKHCWIPGSTVNVEIFVDTKEMLLVVEKDTNWAIVLCTDCTLCIVHTVHSELGNNVTTTTTVQPSKKACTKTAHTLAPETPPSNWQSSQPNRGREQSRSHLYFLISLTVGYVQIFNQILANDRGFTELIFCWNVT